MVLFPFPHTAQGESMGALQIPNKQRIINYYYHTLSHQWDFNWNRVALALLQWTLFFDPRFFKLPKFTKWGLHCSFPLHIYMCIRRNSPCSFLTLQSLFVIRCGCKLVPKALNMGKHKTNSTVVQWATYCIHRLLCFFKFWCWFSSNGVTSCCNF